MRTKKGSPAHAGIDPRPAWRFAPSHWAPPPTRGSTLLTQTDEIAPHGSPAHAGIDRDQPRVFDRESRLPRPRGDRPDFPSGLLYLPEAPPPTRGSTRDGRARRWRPCGSPAHAGIDPVAKLVDLPDGRLPRPRGDRPVPPAQGGDRAAAPPPTRGSTRLPHPPAQIGRGSPAHAGIDLLALESSRVDPWLPRPRGDRPLRRRCERKVLTAPPPTRGSTPERDIPLSKRIGSPAHAGIDLLAISFHT